MPDFNDRDKRRVVACRTEQALKNWESGKEKKIDCDVVLTPNPVFFIPEEGTVITREPNQPDLITLTNSEVIVLCDFDTSGGATPPGFIINPGSGSSGGYLVNAGEYESTISYLEIPNITAAQLNHIATLNQELLNTQFSNLDFSNISSLKLNSTQREFLISEIQQTVIELAQVAYGAATAMLVCVFPSDPQIFCCPDSFTSTAAGSRQQCIVLPEGFATSTTSKESANAKALFAGESFLSSCEVGNDPYVKFCPKPPPGAYAANKVGSYTVVADSFFARSKEEANALAKAAAEAKVECLFVNNSFYRNCYSGSILQGVATNAQIQNNEAIQLLNEGDITAFSLDELNSAVQIALASAPECEVCNDPDNCSCQDKFPNHPSDQKSSYGACVTSSTSKEEANRRAKELCLSGLNCASGLGGFSIGGSIECEEGECLTIAEAIEKFGLNGFKTNAPCKAEYGAEVEGRMAENRYCIEEKPAYSDSPYASFFKVTESGVEVRLVNGYVLERVVPEDSENLQIKYNTVTGVDYEHNVDEAYMTWHPISVDQAVYVRFDVDIKGEVSGTPELIIDSSDKTPENGRFYPEVGEYVGQSGEFLYKILELKFATDGTPYAKPFHIGDNIQHLAERVTMRNLTDSTEGTNYNILKDYIPVDDVVQFRTIKQLGGEGVEIIDSESIDSVSFRRIKGTGSPYGQIEVLAADNEVLVRGNGVDGSLTLTDCDGNQIVFLEWKDGLIITGSQQTFEAGCCGCTDTPTDTPTGTP